MTEEGALGLVHACRFGRQTPFRDQTSLLLSYFRISFCVALAVHMLSLSARQWQRTRNSFPEAEIRSMSPHTLSKQPLPARRTPVFPATHHFQCLYFLFNLHYTNTQFVV